MSTATPFVHEFRPAPPAATGSSRRALLLLHGTGGDEHQMLSLGHQLDPTAALLSPRGQVREGTANRFFRRLAEGIFDLPDLILQTQRLAAFIQQARTTYRIDTVPLIAVGYSNGANIALSLLLRHPGLLAGAILLRAMPQQPPDPLPDLAGIPILVSAGQYDPLVPLPMLRNLADLLKAANAQTTTTVHPAGHELTHADLTDAQTWLAAHSLLAPPTRPPTSTA